jgi:transcriptional regulator with XRE-family HTH domain
MSQERVGDALGLTFQQVRKYERAVSRVGASRLFHLSPVMQLLCSNRRTLAAQ